MNGKRVVAGGLLAGLVLNLGEFILNMPVIGAEFDAAMQSLGVPAMTGGAIGMFVISLFLVGIVAVWLYAAVRPRLGAGPRTALVVGLVVYVLACLFPNIGMLGMGILPARLLLIATAWQLIEVPLAVLAGAWAYREEPAAVAVAA